MMSLGEQKSRKKVKVKSEHCCKGYFIKAYWIFRQTQKQSHKVNVGRTMPDSALSPN